MIAGGAFIVKKTVLSGPIASITPATTDVTIASREDLKTYACQSNTTASQTRCQQAIEAKDPQTEAARKVIAEAARVCYRDVYLHVSGDTAQCVASVLNNPEANTAGSSRPEFDGKGVRWSPGRKFFENSPNSEAIISGAIDDLAIETGTTSWGYAYNYANPPPPSPAPPPPPAGPGEEEEDESDETQPLPFTGSIKGTVSPATSGDEGGYRGTLDIKGRNPFWRNMNWHLMTDLRKDLGIPSDPHYALGSFSEGAPKNKHQVQFYLSDRLAWNNAATLFGTGELGIQEINPMYDHPALGLRLGVEHLTAGWLTLSTKFYGGFAESNVVAENPTLINGGALAASGGAASKFLQSETGIMRGVKLVGELVWSDGTVLPEYIMPHVTGSGTVAFGKGSPVTLTPSGDLYMGLDREGGADTWLLISGVKLAYQYSGETSFYLGYQYKWLDIEDTIYSEDADSPGRSLNRPIEGPAQADNALSAESGFERPEHRPALGVKRGAWSAEIGVAFMAQDSTYNTADERAGDKKRVDLVIGYEFE